MASMTIHDGHSTHNDEDATPELSLRGSRSACGVGHPGGIQCAPATLKFQVLEVSSAINGMWTADSYGRLFQVSHNACDQKRSVC